ncbi:MULTISPECIES: hypothetical protein [unclassified Frankia]
MAGSAALADPWLLPVERIRRLTERTTITTTTSPAGRTITLLHA